MSAHMIIHRSLIFPSRFFVYLFLTYSFIAAGIILYINNPVAPLEKVGSLDKKKKNKAIEISPGSLFLPSSSFLPSFPDLSNKIQISCWEPRPDSEKKEKCFELFLLSDGSSKLISSNDKVFLCYDKSLKFSETQTNFFLNLMPLRSDMVKVVVRGAYRTPDGRDKIEESSFEVKIHDQDNQSSNKEEEDYLSLKSALFLGPDLSLDLSEKTKSLSQLNRLIFPSKNILYVKEGDILLYVNNKWLLKDKDDDTKKYSLARVSLTSSVLDLDFWKKGEIKKRVIKLSKSLPATTLRVSDDFISELNIRTKRQVSCKIQGQRIVIKEKDLLYKKEGLWNKGSLNDLETINDATEFFIFDKLNILPESKNFTGYLFNNDKTQVVKVEKNILKKLTNHQISKNAKTLQNKKRK
jgi:hypothetical protein